MQLKPLIAFIPMFKKQGLSASLLVNLAKATLKGANLRGANLAGDQLSMADLSAVNLIEANLGGACLQGANLVDADLSEARLLGAVGVQSTQLNKTILIGAVMPDGRFHE